MNTDPGASSKRTFHTLDALRGLAAVAVVMFHQQVLFDKSLVINGGLAVDLFFIMSGVVLTHAYGARFDRGMTWTSFMRIRLIRLYPLYLVSLALAISFAALELHGQNFDRWTRPKLLMDAALGVLMLPSAPPGWHHDMFPLDPPTWSLFFELVINLAFVVFWRFLSIGRLAVVCALCIPMLVVYALPNGNLDYGSMWSDVGIAAVRTLFGFSVGVIIAMARPVRPARQNVTVFLVLILLVMLTLFLPLNSLGRGIVSLISVVFLFPAVVLVGTEFDPPAALIPFATAAGLMSYALYVSHIPVAGLLVSTIDHTLKHGIMYAYWPWSGAVITAALVVVALALDHFYDAPVRSYLSRKNRLSSKTYTAIRTS